MKRLDFSRCLSAIALLTVLTWSPQGSLSQMTWPPFCGYLYGQWDCQDSYSWSANNFNGCGVGKCDANNKCDLLWAADDVNGEMRHLGPAWKKDQVLFELPNVVYYAIGHEPLLRTITPTYEICFYIDVCNMNCTVFMGMPDCTRVTWIPRSPVGGWSGTEGALCPPPPPPPPPPGPLA